MTLTHQDPFKILPAGPVTTSFFREWLASDLILKTLASLGKQYHSEQVFMMVTELFSRTNSASDLAYQRSLSNINLKFALNYSTFRYTLFKSLQSPLATMEHRKKILCIMSDEPEQKLSNPQDPQQLNSKTRSLNELGDELVRLGKNISIFFMKNLCIRQFSYMSLEGNIEETLLFIAQHDIASFPQKKLEQFLNELLSIPHTKNRHPYRP